jgi:hypothetical protein
MPRSEGLDSLDRERATSLADEGGSSGAAVDGDEPAPDAARRASAFWRAACLGLAAATVLYLRRYR